MSLSAARRWAQHALTALGLLLLAWLVRRIGVGTIVSNIAGFGPWFLLLVLVGAASLLTLALCWWLIQRFFFQRAPLLKLFRVRIISDAFNLLLPSGSLGGDAMRAFLVRDAIPLRDGIPSVLFDKTVEFVASIVFLGSGLFLGLALLRLPLGLVVPALASLGVTSVGIALLVLVQKRGVAASVLRLSRLLPFAAPWIRSRAEQLETMDRVLHALYSRSNPRALVPLALHVVARCYGVVEVMIVTAVLGAPMDFVQALFIVTMVTSANTIFFLLPGQWGVTEGAHVLVLQSMGFPPALGLSLSIIRRIRKLAFVATGVTLFALGTRAGLAPGESFWTRLRSETSRQPLDGG